MALTIGPNCTWCRAILNGKDRTVRQSQRSLNLSPTTGVNPKAEYFVLQDVLKLRDLAREALNDRDQEIFFAIHFEGYGRKEVGERLGLTSQRIGQIYNAALDTFEARPDYPFDPRP